MPSLDERSQLELDLKPLGPASATWRRGVDWRTILASRAILLLEVAHPVVGAGVADHSEFLSDRWARISRTVESASRIAGFKGPDASIAEGRRLRELHSGIKGVDSAGRKYHALNADAYLWVHATGYAGPAEIRRVFGGQFDEVTEDALFGEWQDLARILRIPDRVIPPTRSDFWSYYEETVNDRLERNSTTELVLDLDSHPMPPHPHFRLPRAVWNIPAVPMAALLRLTTAGLLPSTFRNRIGIEWDARREARFARAVRAIRLLDAALPDIARYPLSRRSLPPTALCPNKIDETSIR